MSGVSLKYFIFIIIHSLTVHSGPALPLESLSNFLCPKSSLALHSQSINLISFSTVSFHLVLGLPCGRFLFIFPVRTFFNISPSVLHTCLSHSRRLYLIYMLVYWVFHIGHSAIHCVFFSYIPRSSLYSGPYTYIS